MRGIRVWVFLVVCLWIAGCAPRDGNGQDRHDGF